MSVHAVTSEGEGKNEENLCCAVHYGFHSPHQVDIYMMYISFEQRKESATFFAFEGANSGKKVQK